MASVSFTDVNATQFGDFQASAVGTADDDRFDDNGGGGMAQSEMSQAIDTSGENATAHNAAVTQADVDANMMDFEDTYGESHQPGKAPYFSNPPIEPALSNALDDSMASVNIQADPEEASPTQAHTGDVSSEEAAPSKPKAKPKPTPKPKRTPAKRGAKAKKQQEVEVEVAEQQDDDEGADADADDDNDDDFAPEATVAKKTRTPRSTGKRKAATPKKTKSAAKTPTKTQKTRKSTAKGKGEMPFNRQRRAPKNGIMEGRVIPRSYEECDEADKMLIDMREREQKTWKDIRQAWEESTGQKTGNSTLPNRYERLKDNFSIIKEEDRPRLLAAKDEVERGLAEKKWALIAEAVKANGGDQYTADNLNRQWKKLMVKEGLRPPPGIVDKDFQIAISEDEVGGEG